MSRHNRIVSYNVSYGHRTITYRCGHCGRAHTVRASVYPGNVSRQRRCSSCINNDRRVPRARRKSMNRKKNIFSGGAFKPRIFHRAARPRKSARFLVKCGCCDESVEIYYGGGTLEIGGVMASVEEWRKLLLPLLEEK